MLKNLKSLSVVAVLSVAACGATAVKTYVPFPDSWEGTIENQDEVKDFKECAPLQPDGENRCIIRFIDEDRILRRERVDCIERLKECESNCSR